MAANGESSPRKIVNHEMHHPFDFSPDGKSIAFVTDPTNVGYSYLMKIFISDKNGSNRRELKTDQVVDNPVFTRDGKSVFFLAETWPNGPSGTPDKALWRIDINGQNAEEVLGPRLFNAPLSFNGQ